MKLPVLLIVLAPALWAQHPAAPKPVELRHFVIKSALAIPLRVERRIDDHISPDHASIEYVAIPVGKRLAIDTDGDGEIDVKIKRSKPQLIELGPKEDRKQLLIYYKRGQWYSSPGGFVGGRLGKTNIALLDGNRDGRFDGDEDYMRVGDGAFFRHHTMRLIRWKDRLAYYRLRTKHKKLYLDLRIDAKTPGLSDAQWNALLEMNSLRMRSGLPATRMAPTRAREMADLARQLMSQKWDYSRPWQPWGPKGPKLKKRALLRTTADPVLAIDEASRCLVTRLLWMGDAAKGFGFGAASIPSSEKDQPAKGWSAFTIGLPYIEDWVDLVVSPAPGQLSVPHRNVVEQPFIEKDPAFYKKERGYPIIVHFGPVDVRSAKFTLHLDRQKKEIPGRSFSPADPISSLLPENARSAFFIPDKPLKARKLYWVEFHCRVNYEDRALIWAFRTR